MSCQDWTGRMGWPDGEMVREATLGVQVYKESRWF
jgi:hypothetical protein